MRFLALLLASLSFSAVAQVYKWTDENGVTHFGTQPPAGQHESVHIRESSPGAMGKGNPASSDLELRAQRLELKRKREELQRKVDRREAAAGGSASYESPEDSWACKYERERVEEYKILLRELGRKGYRQSEKERLEARLRAAERQAERDCN
jgi:hypothetical protein